MEVISSQNQAKEIIKNYNNIVLVPTMGNLHQGHLSLLDKAREVGKTIITSIYVNPLQFGPNEDFDNYPRTIEDDLIKLEQGGCNFVFYPSEDILQNIKKYKASDLSQKMCGKTRPFHFDGVVTIVNKLFDILNPNFAIFGLKDYQQFLIIRNFFKDSDFNTKIIGSPIIRESDGLAMSSRNSLLTTNDRKIAPFIFEQLTWIKDNIKYKNHDELILTSVEAFKALSLFPEYLSILNPNTLEVAKGGDESLLIAIAVKLGNVRLIDNILVN